MLGGMAYELDSETSERLRKLYAAMSDGELLELAANPGDLTDTAQLVLQGEVAARNLRVQPGEGATGERRWATDSFAGSPDTGTPSALAGVIGAAPVVEEPQESDEHPGE